MPESAPPQPAKADQPDDRAALRRALRDRARELPVSEHDKPRRRFLQRAVAVVVALSVVGLMLLSFSAFLAAMKKVIGLKVVDPAPAPATSMPVFVVPEPASAPPPDEPPSEAQENSAATP